MLILVLLESEIDSIVYAYWLVLSVRLFNRILCIVYFNLVNLEVVILTS